MDKAIKNSGIFGRNPVMSPDNVRAFLHAARTEQGCSVEEAAEQLEVEVAALRKLETTGRSEGVENALRHLGSSYLGVFGEAHAFACLDYQHPLAHFADQLQFGSFELGNVVRAQRERLGLSRGEVCARVDEQSFDVDDLEHIEWGQSISMSSEFEKLGAALGLPLVEVLRLNGDFATEDIEEWIAWRDAQKVSTRRKRRAA